MQSFTTISRKPEDTLRHGQSKPPLTALPDRPKYFISNAYQNAYQARRRPQTPRNAEKNNSSKRQFRMCLSTFAGKLTAMISPLLHSFFTLLPTCPRTVIPLFSPAKGFVLQHRRRSQNSCRSQIIFCTESRWLQCGCRQTTGASKGVGGFKRRVSSAIANDSQLHRLRWRVISGGPIPAGRPSPYKHLTQRTWGLHSLGKGSLFYDSRGHAHDRRRRARAPAAPSHVAFDLSQMWLCGNTGSATSRACIFAQQVAVLRLSPRANHVRKRPAQTPRTFAYFTTANQNYRYAVGGAKTAITSLRDGV
jgi:hypothetical protein